MSLFERASSRACEQGPSGRARLAGAVRMFKQRFQRQPEIPASLAKVNAALDDLSPLPEKIALLKRENLQRDIGVDLSESTRWRRGWPNHRYRAYEKPSSMVP
ncbi:Uncharacterised protein [uncultured archaeon]|nr:Uncharacterised protein [uncultured archaeon]